MLAIVPNTLIGVALALASAIGLSVWLELHRVTRLASGSNPRPCDRAGD